MSQDMRLNMALPEEGIVLFIQMAYFADLVLSLNMLIVLWRTSVWILDKSTELLRFQVSSVGIYYIK